MTHHLIAIDPGETSGVALFIDSKLAACGKCKPCDLPSSWTRARHDTIIEIPTRVHGGRKAESILKLSFSAGRWMQYLASTTDRLVLVPPQRWKGNLSKRVHQPMILDRLTYPERQIYIKAKTSHDTIDAIGLGHYYLAQWEAHASIKHPKTK